MQDVRLHAVIILLMNYACIASRSAYTQLHRPGTRYRLTLDLAILYTPLKTPQNTYVQTVLT